jgi:putative endonuclease
MRAGRGAAWTGRAAEAIAERLYLGEGARVLARRWRCAEGEIDLVLALGPALVFVEVKARRSLEDAAAALSAVQAARIAAAATRFLAADPAAGGHGEARIDVVLVARDGTTERIENAVILDG